MEKKRRKKIPSSSNCATEKKYCSFRDVSKQVSAQKHCGVTSKKFRFLEQYGFGNFDFHFFDGLYIGILDVHLKKNLLIDGSLPKNFLELSFLIEGEQIIKIKGVSCDFVYESQECYLTYLPDVYGSILYYSSKPLKEIKIRMDMSFITKHQLDSTYGILKRYAIHNLDKDITRPLSVKTQGVLSEILSDKRSGLLKRLFLESKTLELITLILGDDVDDESKHPQIVTTEPIIKKLYQIQHLIISDLSVQHSIPQLAREIGLNDFILKKEFKRIFGKTIFEYASEQRMDTARNLLQHSKKAVYEISELVGYKNPTHFTAAFKKVEGITPKKYRMTHTLSIK